eukprot:TRINITY_DN80449_c0_g1_i1.p1 TRINITY_DN80449_c0_g1~~TRINITY_DN80449_c0_g1_i1.p1  ORF type:complete len:253 (+),score=64.14 TRINITY_DN80449_c0_g1_i1:80-760(+)
MAVTFHYFPVFAKGPAIALALEHSGMEWKGAFVVPADWKAMKPTTPWGELPVLEIPGVGMLGHEIAILSYVARQVPAMSGDNDVEWSVSQQLLYEAEDIYAKLGKYQHTIMVRDKCTPEELQEFWNDVDATKHNRAQGLHVYLTHLEKFYTTAGKGEGKFTASGKTIGECKLWATLHMLKMLKDDIFANYPGLKAFYDAFGALKETQSVITTGAKFPEPFKQYFVN